MHPINDEKYKDILVKALETAHDSLSQNDVIMKRVLSPEKADKFSEQNGFVLGMINNVKTKVTSDMPLHPGDVATVNRALVEYIQKVENTQSHMMYMVQDLNDLKDFKLAVEDVHKTQMRFSAEQSQDQAQKMQLMQRNRPSPM